MSVLRNGTCQKDRERYDSSSKKSYEDHVRTGLRNDSDKGRKYDHQGCIVADPMLYVDMLKSESENNKDSEGPCECSRKMLLDDMLPEVLFYKVVRGEKQDEQHDYAETCKQHVHPVLAKKVDAMMMLMHVGLLMYVGLVVHVNMLCGMVVGVCCMVVAEMSARKSRDEHGESYEHKDAFPTEMALSAVAA